MTLPSGQIDTFTYNGLGLRVGKTDSTGSYSYACDGASPGSPVLSDGHAVYTPGESDNRGGVSSYLAYDRLGNLWFADNGTAATNQTFYEDFSGFGSGQGMGIGGTESSPFKYGGANGCQTDTDLNFVLMGHRYYDSRQGRFISQDPAGDGTNWYTYAGNNPVNHTDPLGLWINSPFPEDPGASTDKMITDSVDHGALPGETYDVRQGKVNGKILATFTIPAGNVFNFGAVHILVPPGVDIDRNIRAARSFMASNASKSLFHYGGLKHDVNKIAAWLIKNVDTGKGQDYKTGGGVYDRAGHFNYAAEARELGFELDAIIAGQQFVHEIAHPGSSLEPTNFESLGLQYDEKVYRPGPALWDTSDAAGAFLTYKTGM